MRKILNYIQITDEIATSGQPLKSQFKLIADSGHSAIINLAMHDSDNAINNEGQIVTSLGMSYFHIPVPFDAPTLAQLQLFIKVLSALDGEKVWVHCALNYRVSAFMYHYLMQIKGLPECESRSPILNDWQMDQTWTRFMALRLPN